MSSTILDTRRAGVLLHPTSLPSGKLDRDAERWIEYLAATGFSVWQVLPLGEPQVGLSPYQCSSAFALNPALFDSPPAIQNKDSAFITFCRKQAFWLDDYAMFTVLKEEYNGKSWAQWPEAISLRDKTALTEVSASHADRIEAIKWQQYCYDKRWHEIREKARQHDILLFGDMPIFVAYDSADVWAHEQWFRLDDHGNMKVVTGVPPDYFSETGQRWGNPHYNWSNMQQDGYSWWLSRIDHHLELFDFIRIDHFRGLEAAWVINADCETAIDGEWQQVPGDDLLNKLKASLDSCHEQLPFVAEDLGIITPEVTAIRKKYHLPGMSVLQFGFDAFDDNPHKLKNIETDRVVYTGTHDNDTTLGWFDSLEEYDKKHILASLALPQEASDHDDQPDARAPASVTGQDNNQLNEDEGIALKHGLSELVVDTMITNAMHSRANLAVVPLQDILHLGNEARMNIPGTVDNNWTWQFSWGQLERGKHEKIKELLQDSGRTST